MTVQRAVVVGNEDPEARGRLQISLGGSGAVLWAARVVPIAAFVAHDVPVGAAVWVAFESEDLERPVVLGLVDAPPRTGALSRDLEALGDAWDLGHAAGRADAAGGDTRNPYR